jgi:hypothetical protein
MTQPQTRPPDDEGRAPRPANAEEVAAKTTHHQQSDTTPLSTPTPWEALVGIFPTCSGCGSRVMHYSVRVCFHCRTGAEFPHLGTVEVPVQGLADLPTPARFTARTPIATAAIEATRNNWQVGPLCKREKYRDPDTGKMIVGKKILHPYGKDPVGRLVPHGVLDFTADTATVAGWWRSTPWNIGARVPESMFLLDVDGPDRTPHPGRGLQALAELEAEHGPLPPTFTQITGSGGLHLFFRRPHGKLSEKGLPDGLEYKDHGGYVVLAPSIHPDTGEQYVACDHEVAAPPDWLVDLIVEKPRVVVRKPARSRFWQSHGPSVADDYSTNTSWDDVLLPHGWECLSADPDADGAKWLHPKATSSCSATVKNGCLFVYSPNTPFKVTKSGDPNGYTKFHAHAVLDHNGDMSAAARALRAVI